MKTSARAGMESTANIGPPARSSRPDAVSGYRTFARVRPAARRINCDRCGLRLRRDDSRTRACGGSFRAGRGSRPLEPMLARAKERLRQFANSTCLLGDAAELPFQDLRAELIVSRFGVMFFGDPVAAFANLRRARLRWTSSFRVLASDQRKPLVANSAACGLRAYASSSQARSARARPFRVCGHCPGRGNSSGSRIHSAVFYSARPSAGHFGRRNP